LINAKEIIFLGMSRSGNHAVIDWIIRQQPGRVCFLNCAEGKANPFETCRPLANGVPFVVNYPGFSLEDEREGRFSRKDLLLYSYEDSFLRHVFSRELDKRHDTWVGPSARQFRIILLRDPFNLFASRLQMGAIQTPHTAVRLWKQHARRFLRLRKRGGENELAISYNEWVQSARYRESLAARLDIPFTDAGLDTVSSCAGGSSFDGHRFDGRGRQMPVFDRWRSFRDDSRYRALFDEEVIALSDAAFGRLPARDALWPSPPRRAGSPVPAFA